MLRELDTILWRSGPLDRLRFLQTPIVSQTPRRRSVAMIRNTLWRVGLVLSLATLGQAWMAPDQQAEANYVAIKGRLVCGGDKAPEAKRLDASKEPCCAKNGLVSKSRVVDPKSKGVAHGFAYLPKPTGASPEAEAALM